MNRSRQPFRTNAPQRGQATTSRYANESDTIFARGSPVASSELPPSSPGASIGSPVKHSDAGPSTSHHGHAISPVYFSDEESDNLSFQDISRRTNSQLHQPELPYGFLPSVHGAPGRMSLDPGARRVQKHAQSPGGTQPTQMPSAGPAAGPSYPAYSPDFVRQIGGSSSAKRSVGFGSHSKANSAGPVRGRQSGAQSASPTKVGSKGKSVPDLRFVRNGDDEPEEIESPEGLFNADRNVIHSEDDSFEETGHRIVGESGHDTRGRGVQARSSQSYSPEKQTGPSTERPKSMTNRMRKKDGTMPVRSF